MANATAEAGVGASNGSMTEEQKRIAEVKRQQIARARQGLELQRENILSQRVSNPVRRAALEAALSQIEAELAKLG